MQSATHPPSPEEFLAIRQRMISECAPEIVRWTIPFYGWVNDQPVQNGTGVLFRLGDVHFVIAAAHVLDYPAIHNIPYMTGGEGGKLIPLLIKKVVTSPVPVGYRPEESDMRNDDPWDIGIAELAPDTASQLTPFWRFAQLREAEPSPDAPQAIYYVVGYPFQLTENDALARSTETCLLSYVTAIHEGDRHSRDQKAEILLEYPLENMDINENSVHVPRPEGMSGCGIWRLNDPSQPLYLWRPSQVKLVGIEHRWRKYHRYLVGTSVRHAVQLILEHYPELRRTTSLVYPD